MVVQLKGLWLYDYRVYGCTTIRVVVVRLKGVVTRLGRPADCSRQSCWLGSAALLSLAATFEKQSPSTRKAVSFNSKSSLLQLEKQSPKTKRDVSLNPKKRLLSLIQTSEYAYSIISFRLFNRLLSLIQTSEFASRTISFLRKSRELYRTYLSGGRWRCRLWLRSYLLAGHWDYR